MGSSKYIRPVHIIVLTVLAVIAVNFNHERWKSSDVIHHDINSYYAYLPALIYEKDLSLSFLDDTLNSAQESRYYWPNKSENGKHVIKTTMGMAVTYLPFFAAAHLYAGCAGYKQDGFSMPYHMAIQFSSVFYFVIGLLFLIAVLRKYFSEGIISLTLFCICFGTNAFCYITMAGGNSHPVGFMCLSAFMYFTISWYNNQRNIKLILLGLIFGLMVLVRPVNVIFILFFLLYDINSIKSFKSRMGLFFKNSGGILSAGVSAFAIILPQMLYWKMITGHYFFNSYTGERFFFDNPHISEALFGFRKGWLIYTPVMVFSLIGIFSLRNGLAKYLLPVAVILPLFIYISFSWWCWWYGGSFGQRVMIDMYPLLAIPLAAFFHGLADFKKRARAFVSLLLAFFTFLNLFQLMQFKYNILHYDSMTARNYARIFLTVSAKPDQEQYLHHPDYQKALKGEDEE